MVNPIDFFQVQQAGESLLLFVDLRVVVMVVEGELV